ncbi:MAG: hypothetical protein KDK36_20805, partial [Leptospiraceae bacterium]|nr:hypothetical protein [Leptospiraceae bacterium]
SYPKAQPLSFHPALLDSAKKHSEDMMENGYLSHTNRKGKSPTDRGRLEGYKSGIVENLSGRAGETIEELLHTHYSLLIDYDNLKHSKKPFIHRLNILNPRYTEIGIGISGNYELGKVTENFGRSHEGTYILGVVYMDKNGNGIYDPGEGVEGVKVIPDYGEYYSITSKSGGYSIPININGEKKVEYPIELKGLKWTKEHKKVDEEFRILALEKEEFQEIQDVNVTFEGGILPSKIKKKISIHKPTKLDYKLVQEDGKTWGYHPESPLIVGKNYKLDLKLKTSGSTPKKEDSNIEYPR